jgi:SAM-dependent methyltransferase
LEVRAVTGEARGAGREERTEWAELAATATDRDLKDRILTGFKDGKPFTPYVPTLALPPVQSVLDFGCGLGRNFPYLTTIASRVVGYDLPEMIERCRTAAPATVSLLTGDWSAVSAMRFDLVFASLVLQHIPTAEIERYADGLARMAPVTYILSRGVTDTGENVFDILVRSGLFDIPDCTEVEHDPLTHGLKVIGPASLDEARRAGNDAHYEVLMRPRHR